MQNTPPDPSTQTTQHTSRRQFDERRFFDLLDYVAVRLFQLAMALAAMYQVLKAHI